MSLVTPDFGLIFWMTLIFGIVLLLLWRFGFPAITQSVQERTERINKSISLAHEAEERMRTLVDEQEALLEETRKEQARLVKETAATRSQMIAQARQQAEEEGRKQLEKARAEIAAEKESALRDIRREVALLSLGIAEKVVRRELSSDEAQMAYLDKLIDESLSTRDGGKS